MKSNLRFVFLLTTVCVFASCVSSDKKAAFVKREPQLDYSSPTFSYYTAPVMEPAFNMNCAEFFDLLRIKKPRTVIDTLTAIHEVKPAYLSRHTFVYESFSLHGSSPTAPRAVVYGGDAKMVLTFNGSPKHEGYERIEMFCFNEQKKTFDFRDIAFPLEASESSNLDDLTAIEKKRNYVISPVGGKGNRACTQCHNSPMKPIWDSYDKWPRFYGGVDDRLFSDRKFFVGDQPYLAKEKALWDEFEKNGRHAGRYSILPKLHSVDANSELGFQLSYMNGERIVRELKKLKQAFTAKRYHFAKALICSPRTTESVTFNFKDFRGEDSTGQILLLPANASATAKEIFWANYKYQVEKKRKFDEWTGKESNFPYEAPAAAGARPHYQKLFPGKEFGPGIAEISVDEVLTMAEIKKIMDPMGVDVTSWGMANFGGYTHQNGFDGSGKLAIRLILLRPFIREFMADDPEVSELLTRRESVEIEVRKDQKSKSLLQFDANLCALLNDRIAKNSF